MENFIFVQCVQSGHKCNAAKLVKKISVCVSHFFLISRLIQKIRVDQTEKMILLTPT